MIAEGKMQYLFDERGRRYLDVSACIGQARGHHPVSAIAARSAAAEKPTWHTAAEGV